MTRAARRAWTCVLWAPATPRSSATVAVRRRPGTARAGSTRSRSIRIGARRCCFHRVRPGPTYCRSTGRFPPTKSVRSPRAQPARDQRDLLRRHTEPMQRVSRHLDRELFLAEHDFIRAGFPQVLRGILAVRAGDDANALVGAARDLDHSPGGLRIGKRDHEEDRSIEVSALEHELVTRVAIERERSRGPEILDDPPILFDDEALHVPALERPHDQRPDLSQAADDGMMPERVLNPALDARKRAGAPLLIATEERKPTYALGKRIDRTEKERVQRDADERRRDDQVVSLRR